MKRLRCRFAALIFFFTMSFPIAAHAASTITKTKYDGRDAFRLSDGRSEAIVVPELGRVMRYGFVGGTNFLWNSPAPPIDYGGWTNWGGDKTWPAPQAWWPVLAGANWPPDLAWDGAPHTATVLPAKEKSGAPSLRTESPVSPFNGACVVRTYHFDGGEFVIAQRVEKQRGEPLMISIWSVSQIARPDAVFLPTNPNSIYRDNFLWQSLERPVEAVQTVSPSLLQMRPSTTQLYKVATDAAFSSIAAVKDGVAFLQRAAHSDGNYPDSQGVSVELFNNADAKAPYMEMELLSPLRFFEKGGAWTHSLRWSLNTLPAKDVNSPEVQGAVQLLLEDKTALAK